MAFDSLSFIVFFSLVLALHHAPFSWSVRKNNLLVASYLFYAAWNPPFVLLLALTTLLDWLLANAIAAAETPARRKAILVVALVTNLGALSFFKYGAFLLDNFAVLAAAVGVRYRPPHWTVVLPVGISFYTFHSLSYTIDVYRRKMAPVRSFRDYALFVAFFPQLVAGPITRARDFLPQLVDPKKANLEQAGWGFTLLIAGLGSKIVLADYVFSPVVDAVFSSSSAPTSLEAWLGALSFAGQVFCDFSGYSLCALGAALCLGFHLPENFHFPFGAIGFQDLWRRWHISLSSWLRDYLFIGLGGSRRGTARTYCNLMLTMLIGGLWHGAAWTMIVWGGLQGLCLILERALQSALKDGSLVHRPIWRWPKMLITFLVFSLSLIVFRAQTLSDARMIGLAAAGWSGNSSLVSTEMRLLAVLALGALVFLHGYFRDRSFRELVSMLSPAARITAIAVILIAIVVSGGDGHAFIYFQF